MSRKSPQITDDEARRLWQRAAELQAEAERAAASGALMVPADESQRSLEHVALRKIVSETDYIEVAPVGRASLGLAGAASALLGAGGTWSGWSLGGLAAGALGIAMGPALLVPAGTGALNNFLTSVSLAAEAPSSSAPVTDSL